MHRWNYLAAVVFLAMGCSAFGAGAREYGSFTIELSIGGVPCGRVRSFEGGDPRANVVLANAAGSALPKKHPGNVSYAPITLEVDFPPAQPILDWISDLCANRKTRKSLLISVYDLTGVASGTSLQVNNALLTEVRFPAFDALAKETAHIALVFAPDTTQSSTAVPPMTTSSSGALKKSGQSKDFKIQIGTLPTTKVSRIEPFTISQAYATSGAGELRSTTSELMPPAFSNLILTAPRSDIGAWNTWRDSFVVNGMSDDASEKSGSLQLLASDQTPLITLLFSHIGIVRVAPVKIEAGADITLKFQAELYCENMSIGTAPLIPMPVGPVAATPMSTPVGGTTAPTSPSAEVDSADKGARDPKDFPRPDGTVRKSYSSIRQATYSQENAGYSSKETLDALEDFYSKSLAKAGWEPGVRVENENSIENRHQIVLNWKNALRSAAVTLADMKVGGAGISVSLTTRITP